MLLRPSISWLLTSVLAASFFAVSGCDRAGTPAASTHSPDSLEAAPLFSAPTPAGEEISLASLRGKVVLVDFWASWCEPCKIEMPELERLYQQYREEGFVVVGINLDRDRNKMEDFLKGLQVSFPLALDPKHQVAEIYSPPGMPTSYLIDREGNLVYTHVGYRQGDAAAIEKEILEVLRH